MSIFYLFLIIPWSLIGVSGEAMFAAYMRKRYGEYETSRGAIFFHAISGPVAWLAARLWLGEDYCGYDWELL